MTTREFAVYDVMIAFASAARKGREGDEATGPLIFTAAIEPTLANAVNCSADTVSETIPRLLAKGWLILLREGARRPDGKQAPNEYQVVEHRDFALTHPGSCPPYSYCPDFETAVAHGIKIGERLGEKGEQPAHFRDANATSMIVSHQKTLPEHEAGWLLSDAAPTVPENSGTAKPATVPEIPPPFRRTPPAVPENSASRSGDSPLPVPEFLGRRLVTTDLELQTLTTNQPADTPGVLVSLFLSKEQRTPRFLKGQEQTLSALGTANGAEKVVAAFEVYMKERPYNDRTICPFTAFIRGFSGYLQISQRAKTEAVTGKEPELQAAFKAQDKKHAETFKLPTKEERESAKAESARLKDEI
jgi:hypothetical protein